MCLIFIPKIPFSIAYYFCIYDFPSGGDPEPDCITLQYNESFVFQAYIKIYQGEELPHPKSMLQVQRERGRERETMCV